MAVSFTVERGIPIQDANPSFCWFHPRAAAIPGAGERGGPRVVMTMNRHLDADDHYSGLFYMYTDDFGGSWHGPFEPSALAWEVVSESLHASVHDATPGWHAQTGRLLLIGGKTHYDPQGGHANDAPGRVRTSYAVYDASTDTWTKLRDLAYPDDPMFASAVSGSCQWLAGPDGAVLVPVYYAIPPGRRGRGYGVTVLRCRFDGETLSYVAHGPEIVHDTAKGFTEASLAAFRGVYYLTLRGEVDENGYVATSSDGLHFSPPEPWRFDDGRELGSVNTQQHWLAHSEGLFLCYTSRREHNARIPRHRAPLYIAQVDPKRLRVIRETERALIPDRGLMLGNFGADAITSEQSWVTDAEFLWFSKGYRPTPEGGNDSVWVARVLWSAPNSLAPHSA